ncbi:MAG: 50S ribosomal protein L18 [Nitrospirota bacterium]
MVAESRELGRDRRHKRIRKKIFGSSDRLRLSVYRSLNHVYAQLIDDSKGQTVVSASSLDKEFKDVQTHKGNVTMAKKVGQLIARRALEKGFKKVVLDRGGYLYHGSVKALAEAAREAGLQF